MSITIKETDYQSVEIKNSWNKLEQIKQVSYSVGSRDWFNVINTIKNCNWFYIVMKSPLSEHQKDGLCYWAMIENDEEGGFIASVPTLKGCITEGETFDEAIQFLRDAMVGWLQVAQEKNLPIPSPDGKIDI